jgi:hypothetical protein
MVDGADAPADWLDTAPAAESGLPSPCPFAADPTGRPGAWAALHDDPSPGGMVAMNLMRMEGKVGTRYKEYASHFGELPGKYGLKVLATASVGDPESSVVLGSVCPDRAGFTMLGAVQFPCSRVFESCWSDPLVVQRGFPLRAQMWEDGFEHVWLRCDAAGSRGSEWAF